MEQHTGMGVWLQGAACFGWCTQAGQPGLAMNVPSKAWHANSLIMEALDVQWFTPEVTLWFTPKVSSGKIFPVRRPPIFVAFAVRARLVSQLNSKSIPQLLLFSEIEGPWSPGPGSVQGLTLNP